MGQIANKLLRLNTEKHRIREAIGRKGVELTPATPLAQYAPAIDSIDTGQVLVPDDYQDISRVVFVDYDGTVLKDVYVRRGHPVAAPIPPEHPHLAFHGWNRAQAKLDSVQQDMCVGALYDVEDGENWLHVTGLNAGTFSLKVTTTMAAYKEIDWGDGEATEITGGGNYTHVYAAEFTGWIKLTGCCIANTSSSLTINDKIDEILASWWDGNVYTSSSSTLRAVCYGVGADVNGMTLRPTPYFRGFVFGWLGGTRRPTSLNFNSTPGFPAGQFFLSTGEGNTTGGVSGTAPTTATFPIFEEYGSRARSGTVIGRVSSIVLGEDLPSTISFSGLRLQHLGQSLCGGNYYARTVLIEEGAVPVRNTSIDFAVTINAEAFLARLGSVSEAITLTLRNVPLALRDAISTALTAKGYTVAFN